MQGHPVRKLLLLHPLHLAGIFVFLIISCSCQMIRDKMGGRDSVLDILIFSGVFSHFVLLLTNFNHNIIHPLLL